MASTPRVPTGFFVEDPATHQLGANRLYEGEDGQLHVDSYYIDTIQGRHFWEDEDKELTEADYAFAASHPRVR